MNLLPLSQIISKPSKQNKKKIHDMPVGNENESAVSEQNDKASLIFFFFFTIDGCDDAM